MGTIPIHQGKLYYLTRQRKIQKEKTENMHSQTIISTNAPKTLGQFHERLLLVLSIASPINNNKMQPKTIN